MDDMLQQTRTDSKLSRAEKLRLQQIQTSAAIKRDTPRGQK